MKAWVTYLAMTRPPGIAVAPPDDPGIRIAPERLDPAAYLALFRLVGEPLGWDLRLKMSATALAACLASPASLLVVLRIDGIACGLCEFERQADGAMQLLFFGIAARCEGRGLGRALLLTALARAWAERPTQIWLHTDTCDSPKALPLYRAVGFEEFEQRYEDVSAF
jgi:ribosomal protein S18 acetylase RimI-like enzyme